HLARTHPLSEGGPGLLDPQRNPLAAKLAGGVAQQRTRQEPGFLQYLEPVADAQDETAVLGKARHRLHHRREARYRPAAQVVAVGEAAGKDHQVQVAQVALAMADVAHRFAQDVVQRVGAVAVAPRAREDDDARFHARLERAGASSATRLILKSSITELASSCRAMDSVMAAASARSSVSRVRRSNLPARTSSTAVKPSAWSALLIVEPWGSLTTGLSVTMTSAWYKLPCQAMPGFEIACLRPGHHLLGEGGAGGLLVPPDTLEVVAHVLLVEGRRRRARPVAFPVPEARGVRSQQLVDQDQPPVDPAVLELGIGQDQAPGF